MSNSESFIEEVTEEVRRDQLFAMFRRYGWIAVAVVIAIVGGAAFNEWQKARTAQNAQAMGDAILAALESNDSAEKATALGKIEADGDASAVTAFLASADDIARDDRAAAMTRLEGISNDPSLSQIYRDLAALKLVLLMGADAPAKERLALLDPLSAAGAPYGLLAKEQIALINVEIGNTEKALGLLQDILSDAGVTTGLRRRVSQLIVALGGKLDAA